MTSVYKLAMAEFKLETRRRSPSVEQGGSGANFSKRGGGRNALVIIKMERERAKKETV